jgi:tetratricopeptide (TPR) repeat protein
VLGLRARDCRTGDVLAEEQVQAARKEEVLYALSRVASKFRARLGESLTTVKEHDTPLAEATTPSLEALKAYSEGWQVSYSSGSAASLPFFQRAIEIDPNFASAYAALGRMYGDIGEVVLSAQNISKAYQLRDRASDQEKFFIISVNYDLQVTGNLERVQQTCALWMQAYPRVSGPHALLSGGVYSQLGRYEKAVEEVQIAEFVLGANGLYPAYVRGLAYLAAHEGAEAVAEFRKILDHRGIVLCDPVGALAHVQLGRTYALLGDKTKARSAYQDFLTLWKDADPDIPTLKQATAEYADLH